MSSVAAKLRVHLHMRTTATALLFAATVLYPLACKSPVRKSTMNSLAAQYLQLAVALGERDPDSLDFYFGPAGTVAENPC